MHLYYSKKILLLGVTTFLMMHVSITARGGLARTTQASAIARIEHIIVNGGEKTEAGVEDARVTRASSNEIQSVQAGMLLYANDLITTGNNVKLIIHSLNTSKANDSKAILYPNTEIRIIDNTSYSVILGRAWFSVKGWFRVRAYRWVLGARGTEFEVQADRSNSATLTVLEGVVGVSSTQANTGRAVGRGASALLDVKALEEVSLTRPGRLMKPGKLTEQQVRSILSSTNEAILASQPAFPARRVLPHFDSTLERGRVFQSARFDAIWRGQPESFNLLGKVYSDWGEGAKALEAYNKELSLSPRLQNSFNLLANLGEAYWLIGDMDKAEQLLTRALDMNRDWARALNALGNVYFGKASIALSNKDLDIAKALLQKATKYYEQSFASISVRGAAIENRRTVMEAAALSNPSSDFMKSIADAENALPFSLLSMKGRLGIDSGTLRQAYFAPADSGVNLKGGALFTGWSNLAQAGELLKTGWQNSPDRLDQSKGVTKANIGDTKTLLGDIAQKENEPEEAARLYEEAAQAYSQAITFYPQYPYLERELIRVTQAVQALTPRSIPTRPAPPVEKSRPRREKVLDVPFRNSTGESGPLSIATSLAAVATYIGDTDVEPCQLLNLMNRRDDCCNRRDYRSCLSNESPNLYTTLSRLDTLYDLSSFIDRPISYEAIVSRIDLGQPVIVLFARYRSALVISGYSLPDNLVILVPSLEGERSITYKQLQELEWDATVRLRRRRPLPEINRVLAIYSTTIVKSFLAKNFYEVMERFPPDEQSKFTSDILEQGWRQFVEPLGPLDRFGEPRVRTKGRGIEVHIKCRFKKGIANFIVYFNSRGQLAGLWVRP